MNIKDVNLYPAAHLVWSAEDEVEHLINHLGRGPDAVGLALASSLSIKISAAHKEIGNQAELAELVLPVRPPKQKSGGGK